MRRIIDAPANHLGRALLARILRALANSIEPPSAVTRGGIEEDPLRRFPGAPDSWLKFVARHRTASGPEPETPGHQAPMPLPSPPAPQPGVAPREHQMEASFDLRRGREPVFARVPKATGVDDVKLKSPPRIDPAVRKRRGLRFDVAIGNQDGAGGREPAYLADPPASPPRWPGFGSPLPVPFVVRAGDAGAALPSPVLEPPPVEPGWQKLAVHRTPPALEVPQVELAPDDPGRAVFPPAQALSGRLPASFPPVPGAARSTVERSAPHGSGTDSEPGAGRLDEVRSPCTEVGGREAIGAVESGNERRTEPEWAKAGRLSRAEPSWSSPEPHRRPSPRWESDLAFEPGRWPELPHEREDDATALMAVELLSRRARVSALSAAQEAL